MGGEQPVDPVDVPHPLAHQRPALAADTPPVLLLRRRRPGHRTHPRLATLVSHQGAHQGLTIDPVGLRPPTPARGQDRGGVDDVALDPFRLQHPVDPKAVQTRLLDDNNREVPAGPRRSFALELGEPTQQPRHSPAGTECLDIFSPPPGDRDVISQVLRDSSSETKIAPSAVRIAACAGRGASSGITRSSTRRSCAGVTAERTYPQLQLGRNQLRCAAIRSLTHDGNSTSGKWPQPASITRRACGNAAASSLAFVAAGATRSSPPCIISKGIVSPAPSGGISAAAIKRTACIKPAGLVARRVCCTKAKVSAEAA